MNRRRIRQKSRILAAALVAALGFGSVPTAYAAPISDAQNKKNQAQSDLDAQNDKINKELKELLLLQENMKTYMSPDIPKVAKYRRHKGQELD